MNEVVNSFFKKSQKEQYTTFKITLEVNCIPSEVDFAQVNEDIKTLLNRKHIAVYSSECVEI